MMRFNRVLVASVLLLVLFTGCNNQDDQADQAAAPTPVAVRKKPKKAPTAGGTPQAGASPGAAQSPAAAGGNTNAKAKAAPANAGNTGAASSSYVKQTLAKLNGYLPAAVKKLQANDVATAKQYVKGFSDNWNQKVIQNGVKTAAPNSYSKISAGVTQVNNLMKPASPNQAQTIAALQSLSQAVNEYTQGS